MNQQIKGDNQSTAQFNSKANNNNYNNNVNNTYTSAVVNTSNYIIVDTNKIAQNSNTNPNVIVVEIEDKDAVSLYKRKQVFFICLFLGILGIHRCYVGKTNTGFLFGFTYGLFFIGWLVDLYLIYNGKFTDISGKYIKK